MVSTHGKIYVTGGAGFIGSHLVDRLLSEGYEVIAIDNLFTGRLENIRQNIGKENFRFIKCDIRDSKFIKSLIRDVDVIFHEAALTSATLCLTKPALTKSVNVMGTLKLLEMALDSGVKRFIYASSAAVYGDAPTPQREDMRPQPISLYGVSKLSAENYVRMFYEEHGLETVCLRYFNVYGPRQSVNSQYGGVITKFIQRLLHCKPLYIHGDGEQSRDFVHVQDVIHANLLALKNKRAAGEIINVGTGKSMSINELAKILLNLMNKNNARIIHTKRRRKAIKHSLADITKAKKILGFSPKCSIKDGLSEVIEHIKNFVNDLYE